MNRKKYRNNGAIGALLDEYERAIEELKKVISKLSDSEFKKIIDTETKDLDCISIQTILTHVIKAGYNYVIYIRNWKGEDIEFTTAKQLDSIDSYINAIDSMFAYNVKLFVDYPRMNMEEHRDSMKIKTSWGQKFDVEQLLEHAIVHILRHRRQIERFILRLN